MLFLIISEPLAEKPSEAKAARRLYWDWLDAKIAEGVIRSCLSQGRARDGRYR